jgi:trehalose utilization protein
VYWRLQDECLRSRGLIPAGAGVISLLQSVRTGSKTYPTFHSKDTDGRGIFQGVKWCLCDADHSHHLVPSLSVSGATPPIPHIPS